MADDSELVSRLVAQIKDDQLLEHLLDLPRFKDDIELALIDAIFSARARYGQPAMDGRPATGVQGVVQRWGEHRRASSSAESGFADDLAVLEKYDETHLLEVLGNRGRLAQRSKAQIVLDAAAALVQEGFRHAKDLNGEDVKVRLPEANRAFLGVRGCGKVLWSYFCMQLGRPDVKADTWVLRYVGSAVGVPAIRKQQGGELLKAAAAKLGVSQPSLDHVVWRHASGRILSSERLP